MSTIKLHDCQHDLDVSDVNLEGSHFSDVRLAESTFESATLEASKFTDVVFDTSVIEHSSLVGVSIKNCDYEGMRIDGVAVKDLLEAYQSRVEEPA